MAKNSVAKPNHSTGATRLLVFLSCLSSMLCADAHSLRCNLNIKAPSNAGQPWCEAQCSADGIFFLHYNNINNTMPLDNLGKLANATEVQTCLTQWLEGIGQELRKKVSNIKVDTSQTSGHPTLQVTMLFQKSQGQIVSAYWQFNISEKYFFIFHTMNKTWELINDVPGDVMNELKDDATLMKDLNFSIAECSQKSSEFLKQHKESPRSTPGDQYINQITSPTQLPPASPFPYMNVSIALGLIFIILLIVCICIYVKRKCCTQGDRNPQLPKDCCISLHKPQKNEGPEETRAEVPNQTTKMLSQEEEPKAWG